MPRFTTTWLIENEFYLGLPFLWKILILNPLGFLYRGKYYTAWYVGQMATNLSGLSQDKEGEYTLITAVDIKFELEPNPKLKTQY